MSYALEADLGGWMDELHSLADVFRTTMPFCVEDSPEIRAAICVIQRVAFNPLEEQINLLRARGGAVAVFDRELERRHLLACIEVCFGIGVEYRRFNLTRDEAARIVELALTHYINHLVSYMNLLVQNDALDDLEAQVHWRPINEDLCLSMRETCGVGMQLAPQVPRLNDEWLQALLRFEREQTE